MTYLPSTEALRRLCETKPVQHVREGIKNIGLGIAGLGVGAGSGVGFYATHTHDLIFELKAVGYAGSVIVGSVGVGLGVYQLSNGVTLLIDPLLTHTEDGYVRYRNGGYVSRPSRFDRRFGTIVHPVDSIAELSTKRGGQVFFNGVTLRERKFERDKYIGSKKRRRKIVEPISLEEVRRLTYPDNVRASVGGEFNGGNIRARITGNERLIKAIAKVEEDATLYLQGPFNRRQHVLSLVELDEALTAT